MKLTKRKDYTGSIRTVWNDDKTARFGMVGTVRDFLDVGILDYCFANDGDWVYIQCMGSGQPQNLYFFPTREEALAAARKVIGGNTK